MKKCTHCKETKPLSAFGLRNRKSSNGEVKVVPNCYCKLCNSQRAKDRYADIKSKGLKFVYKLINSSDEIIYVGKTESLPTRTNRHFSKTTHLYSEIKHEKNIKLQYIAMTSTAMMQIREIYYINKYKPKYNTIYNNSEPTVIISDFEFDVWLDFEGFNDIKIQNGIGIDNEFYDIVSIFKRKRNDRYLVYIEVKRNGKIKQVNRGSFEKEKDAENLVTELRKYYLS